MKHNMALKRFWIYNKDSVMADGKIRVRINVIVADIPLGAMQLIL
jgi:hypothetical protein